MEAMVNVEVKKTVGIMLDVTPEELATITAALGATRRGDLTRSVNVSEGHLVVEGTTTKLFRNLRDVYHEAVGKGAFK